MFRFANPEILNFLALIPLLALLFVVLRIIKKRALKQYGDPFVLYRLMPSLSNVRPWLKFILWLSAASLIIITLARPQAGAKLRKEKSEGIEIMICLDVSNSMLAADIKPSRLERAKMALSKLLDNIGDDRIGLIVFAGDAYTQIPITSDLSAVKMFLPAINNKIVPKQGTSISNAIELAMRSFDPNSSLNKAIIIITDGENHEANPVETARECSEKGVRIFTIGVGSPEGCPIAEPEVQNAFRKDNSGQVIITRLDEVTLKSIAVAGKGAYVRATNINFGLKEIQAEMQNIEKKGIDKEIYSAYDDRFQFIILIAFILLFIEILLLERKNKFLSKIKLFN